MEIFSPVLKINKKQLSVQNENLKIYVNNQNDYFDKFKKISKTFEDLSQTLNLTNTDFISLFKYNWSYDRQI